MALRIIVPLNPPAQAVLDDLPGRGFRVRLERNHAKLEQADCAYNYMPGVTWPADGGPIVLEIVLGAAFNQQSIEVNETKTRVKVIIAKVA